MKDSSNNLFSKRRRNAIIYKKNDNSNNIHDNSNNNLDNFNNDLIKLLKKLSKTSYYPKNTLPPLNESTTVKPKTYNFNVSNDIVSPNNIKQSTSTILSNRNTMNNNSYNQRKKQNMNRFICNLDKKRDLDNHIYPDPSKLVQSNDYRRRRLETLVSLNSYNYNKYCNNELKEELAGKYLKHVPQKHRLFQIPLIPSSPKIERRFITIEKEINNIGDLLAVIEENPIEMNCDYNINLKALHDIKQPLVDLNNMIGMNQLKENVVDQLLFYVQNLHNGTNDFMHTCIYGPPGTGKTEIAKIMGRIFSNLGILKKKSFEKVTRSDLIAGYLGQTALKTRDAIKRALGGVLFIDEAYALGNQENRDSFAKECLDTLCECLSDHKDELMVIIAGYEKDLDKCFFSYNQGLHSRFTWRFKTDDYNCNELRKIFHKKVRDNGWKLKSDNIPSIKWFEDKKEYFKYYGRDMETLLSKVKIVHGRRVFCLPEEDKKILTQKDMDKGFEKFLDNGEVKNRKSEENESYKNMYL